MNDELTKLVSMVDRMVMNRIERRIDVCRGCGHLIVEEWVDQARHVRRLLLRCSSVEPIGPTARATRLASDDDLETIRRTSTGMIGTYEQKLVPFNCTNETYAVMDILRAL